MPEIEKVFDECVIIDDDGSTSTLNRVEKQTCQTSMKYLRTTTFNLEPEIIPRTSLTTPRSSDISTLSERMKFESPTEAQLKEICEQNRRKVRRLVAAVCISLTVLCIVLVIVSLSFGPKLEELGLPRKLLYLH